MELEEVQEGLQESVPIQEESHSLPLLATCPGAEAEVEGLRLPWVSGEKLLTRRLPGIEEGS